MVYRWGAYPVCKACIVAIAQAQHIVIIMVVCISDAVRAVERHAHNHVLTEGMIP